jgi:signal peptidase I
MWILILVGGLLGIARATAIRWLTLPTDDPIFEASVLPSMSGGDTIVVARVTRPVFGDLVICPEPDYPSRYIIGRIIGESGDSVVLDGGVPTVGGKGFVRERSCDPSTFVYSDPNNEAEEITLQCDMEALANHLHKVGTFGGHHVSPVHLEFDVPEGKLFLLSDNRLHPYDSRDFGFVDADSCRETVVLRLASKKGWTDAKNRMNYIQ